MKIFVAYLAILVALMSISISGLADPAQELNSAKAALAAIDTSNCDYLYLIIPKAIGTVSNAQKQNAQIQSGLKSRAQGITTAMEELAEAGGSAYSCPKPDLVKNQLENATSSLQNALTGTQKLISDKTIHFSVETHWGDSCVYQTHEGVKAKTPYCWSGWNPVNKALRKAQDLALQYRGAYDGETE